MDYNTNFRTELNTIQEAEQYAAKNGVVLTANDRAKIADLQNAERERIQATQAQHKRWSAAWFDSIFAALLEAMLHIQDLVQAFARTLIVGVGITAILIIALIVEQQRLVDGVLLFEKRAEIAHFAAWFVVLMNASMEFVIFYEDQKRGWQDDNRHVWSLKIAMQNLNYRLGRGDNWTERKQPPSFWARQMLRLVTIGVLALALFGSMKEEMALYENNYMRALYTILTESTLLQMATWIAGLLFAFIAVRGAQGTARYLAARTAEVVEDLNAKRTNEVDDNAIDAPAVAYIMAKLAKKEQRDAAKADAAVIDREPVHVGNGHNGAGHNGHGF